MFSLLSEKARVRFIDSLEKGIIQESVLSQATAGPMMMLSLFHELQNPLFKKNNFDPDEFLEGVIPALENFHNVSGALENELHRINKKLQKSYAIMNEEPAKDTDEGSNASTVDLGAVTKEEKESLLSALKFLSDDVETKKKRKDAEAILDHEWMEEARENPDSLAAQLSRMVTKELFQINQLSSKTAFLLQNQTRNILFREGSCQVNNVALLSARACLFKEKELPISEDKGDVNEVRKEYEPVEYNYDDEYDVSETAVAAQLEVLYDVTQEFIIGEPGRADRKETEQKESTQTTIVSVATLEGWLHGGPDGAELRWKLASYRPPYEFPYIEQAYKY